jgi:hypothetical protein
MSRINWSRVILGGLVAGLIINISGITLAHVVLGEEYVKAVSAKMMPRPLWQIMAQHLSMRFWFGIIAVFLYAAMRPRFGPGPRTAVIAGLTLFLSVGFVMTMSLYSLGLLHGRNLLIGPIWTLCETELATLVGAWIYREPLTTRAT